MMREWEKDIMRKREQAKTETTRRSDKEEDLMRERNGKNRGEERGRERQA